MLLSLILDGKTIHSSPYLEGGIYPTKVIWEIQFVNFGTLNSSLFSVKYECGEFKVTLNIRNIQKVNSKKPAYSWLFYFSRMLITTPQVPHRSLVRWQFLVLTQRI